MKIVCYAFKGKNGELESPFMEYLEKYAVRDRDPKKKKSLKLKQLANIESHLNYLAEHRGKYDLLPLAQKYKNRSIAILKIKESSKLVRIAFFTKKGSTIILLNAIDKPKLYEKGKKQQVDKVIEKFLDQAEEYKNNYMKSNLSMPLNL